MPYPPLPVAKQYGEWFPEITTRGVPIDEESKEIKQNSMALQTGESSGPKPKPPEERPKEVISLPKKIEFGALRLWVSGAGRDSVSYDDGPSFDLKAHDIEFLESDEDEPGFSFAPGVDEKSIKIRWHVHGLSNIKTAKLELFCRGHDKAIWEHHWGNGFEKETEKIDAFPQSKLQSSPHTTFCELPFAKIKPDTALKLKNAEGKQETAFPKGLLTVARSPYQLRLTVSGCDPKGTPENGDQFAYPMTAWTYFHVLVHSFKYEYGPKEWLSDKREDVDAEFKERIVGKRSDKEYGLEGELLEELRKYTIVDEQKKTVEMGPTNHHLVSLLCNHNTKRIEDDKQDFSVTYKKMWGDGPRLPLIAKPLIRDISGQPTETNAVDVIHGARLMWDWEEESTDRWKKPTLAKTLGDGKVTQDFLKDIMEPIGKRLKPSGSFNCPEDAGGKHGVEAKPCFLHQATAGDGKTGLPYKVDGCVQRTWAVTTAFDDKGQTGVIFQPGRHPGDTYRVKTYLVVGDELDHERPLKGDESACGSPGLFEVLRRVDIHHLVVGDLPAINLSQMISSARARARKQVGLDLRVKTDRLKTKEYEELLAEALKIGCTEDEVRSQFHDFGLEVPRFVKTKGSPGAALVKVATRVEFFAAMQTLFRDGTIRAVKKVALSEAERAEGITGVTSGAVGAQLYLGHHHQGDEVVYLISEPGKKPFQSESVKGVYTDKQHAVKLVSKGRSCYDYDVDFKNTKAHGKKVVIKFPGGLSETLAFTKGNFSIHVSSSLDDGQLKQVRDKFQEASEKFDETNKTFQVTVEGHKGTSSTSKDRIDNVIKAVEQCVADGMILVRKKLYKEYVSQTELSSRTKWGATMFSPSGGIFGLLSEGMARAYAAKHKLDEGLIVIQASRFSTLCDSSDRNGSKWSAANQKYYDYTDYPSGGYVNGALEPKDQGLIYLITPDPNGAAFASKLKGKTKEPWAVFLHEVGHGLGLPHAPLTRTGQVGAESVVEAEHVEGEACIMSYDSESNLFCGLCMLRLRGWEWKRFRNTVARGAKLSFHVGNVDTLFSADATTEEGKQARVQALGMFNRPLELGKEPEPFKTEFSEAWDLSWKLAKRVLRGVDTKPDEVLADALQEFLFQGGEVPAEGDQARLRVYGAFQPFYGNMDLSLRYGDACTIYTPPGRKELAFKMMTSPGDVQATYLSQNPALGAFPIDVHVTDELGAPMAGVDVYVELIEPRHPASYDSSYAGSDLLGGKTFVKNCGTPPIHPHVQKFFGNHIGKHKPSASTDPQNRNVHWEMGGKRGMQDGGDVCTPKDGIRNVFTPYSANLSGSGRPAVFTPPKHPKSAAAMPNTVKVVSDVEGVASFLFTPSWCGGDGYRLRAYVLDPANADKERGSATSGDMFVWRTLRVGGVYRMPNVADESGLSAVMKKQRKVKNPSNLFQPLPNIDFKTSIGVELAKSYVEVIFEPDAVTPKALDRAFWQRFQSEVGRLRTKYPPIEELRFINTGNPGFQLELQPKPDGLTWEGTLPSLPKAGCVGISFAQDVNAWDLAAHDHDPLASPTATAGTFTALKSKDRVFGVPTGGKWEAGTPGILKKFDLEIDTGTVDYTTGKVTIKLKRAPKQLAPAKSGTYDGLGDTFVISGATPENTGPESTGDVIYGRAHQEDTPKKDTWTVLFYKDSGTSNVVAKATGVKKGAKGVVAGPENSSGLSVTFDLGSDPSKEILPKDSGSVKIEVNQLHVYARYFTAQGLDSQALLETPAASPWLFNVVDSVEYNRRVRLGYTPAPAEIPGELTDFQKVVGDDRDFALTDTLLLRAVASAIYPDLNLISYYPGLLFVQAVFLHPLKGGLGGKGTGNTAFLFSPSFNTKDAAEHKRAIHYLALHEAGHCLYGIHAQSEGGAKNSYHDTDVAFTCIMGSPATADDDANPTIGGFCGRCNATLRGLLTLEEPLFSKGVTQGHDLKPGKSKDIWKKQLGGGTQKPVTKVGEDEHSTDHGTDTSSSDSDSTGTG